MGQTSVHLDDAALREVAEHFEADADLVDSAMRDGLGRLMFDGAAAGRAHAASGAELRRVLDRWAPELTRWSRASAEIAGALRSGLAGYRAAELSAADRVG
ncbi:hypothetical protein KIH27_19970 [Mycobacterium sp. M1]|uniref:ESX-1 secretion-associated protein n=1 Tax=Mycolicibacter acidiphilus TaxID=2835306 RepID=A0ABS5RNI9_9MYCO|nr:type VII secretion target [Mycolicibacter acidiphilus]MBS9535865.1 hypothetical protein [Mycolicibacter acidiphilus]